MYLVRVLVAASRALLSTTTMVPVTCRYRSTSSTRCTMARFLAHLVTFTTLVVAWMVASYCHNRLPQPLVAPQGDRWQLT